MGNEDSTSLAEALERLREELRSRPEVVRCRLGYVHDAGWITKQRALVVHLRTAPGGDAKPELPKQVKGFPVIAEGPTPRDQLDTRPVMPSFAAFRPPKIRYQRPDGVTLEPIDDVVSLTAHVSPEQGWAQLQPFLRGTEDSLVVGMFDFTAPHVVDEVVDLGENRRTLALAIQPGQSIGDGTKAHDLPDEEVVNRLGTAFKRRFRQQWIDIGKDGWVASSYHIKVAVRDDRTVWMSSGSWQSSNQPNSDLSHAEKLRTFNREWHLIVESPALARVLAAHIENDLENGGPLPMMGAEAAEVPDMFVVVEPSDEPALAASVAKPFPPLQINGRMKIRPLLTPHDFAGPVLDLIRSAKHKLYIQNQTFNATRDDTDLERLLQGVLERQQAGVDVRIIFRPFVDSEVRENLDALQDMGFDMARVRLQRNCHTKGVIADGARVLVGSHNWSKHGVAFNRDASLLVENRDVAEYFEQVFLFDWENLARSKVSRTIVELRAARPDEPVPRGLQRIAGKALSPMVDMAPRRSINQQRTREAMKRHGREEFHIIGEGIVSKASTRAATKEEDDREFRFSRMHVRGKTHDPQLLNKLATAMTAEPGSGDASATPAGFTYLGQFVDHDLTLDATEGVPLGKLLDVKELEQGRSPLLDLDCLYGRGPSDPANKAAFEADGRRMKVGTTEPTSLGAGAGNPKVVQAFPGYDLPRTGAPAPGNARIADHRNDENLIVAQVHLAFIRFHNAVAAAMNDTSFEEVRAEVTKHYQWMLRHEYLLQMCDAQVVQDVFTNGRKVFEPKLGADTTATMPIEFSVAAFRFGHSLVRGQYNWNDVFRSAAGRTRGTLALLFKFSGTSGDLGQSFGTSGTRLPSNWVVDWRRLLDFAGKADDLSLAAPEKKPNFTRPFDTMLVNPLAGLPLGSFGGNAGTPAIETNLAFRNLQRGRMLELASGQQMLKAFEGTPALSREQILEGNGGASLDSLTPAEKDEVAENTPLWFYVLREAETLGQGERLGPLGSRIVCETFHRAMQASRNSIVVDTDWRPQFGPDRETFRFVDLVLKAFGTKAEDLAPLGDT